MTEVMSRGQQGKTKEKNYLPAGVFESGDLPYECESID